jgi:hypothetical protein
MKRLAEIVRLDIKKCIFIILGIILFNVITAQPIKLTLELKGAASTGDAFLLDEPIYVILIAKNVSSQNQEMVNLNFEPAREKSLKLLLLSEDGSVKYSRPVIFSDDGWREGNHFYSGSPPYDENKYILTLLPGDTIAYEIEDLLDPYFPRIKQPKGMYRISSSWRNYFSNEIHFTVKEPKGNLLKAYNLYKEAIDKPDFKKYREIMEEFKKKKTSIEPYFVLTHQAFAEAIYQTYWHMYEVKDTLSAFQELEVVQEEQKKIVEEHPNTYIAQRMLLWRRIGTRIGAFPKWTAENDTNYISWLQKLSINYPKTLVGKEARRILESKKEKPTGEK